jgi:putative transcriptional regulator
MEKIGIKQTWLCERLGKSYSQINGYVKNRNQPRLDILFQIAEILGVEVKSLIKEKPKK